MTALRSTYRLADAKLSVKVGAHLKHILDTGIAKDYIEEQWDGDRLVRYRVIRLGADEPCIYRGCFDGVVHGNTNNGYCQFCHGSGVKPRDQNPEWTETNPPFAYWRQMGHDLIDELDDVIEDSLVATDVAKVIYGFLEPRVLVIEAEAVKWKAIATQLYETPHPNDLDEPVCKRCHADWAYESARNAEAQEAGK